MFGLLLPNFKSLLTFFDYPYLREEKIMTSRKKKFQTSPAKKGLSTLQKTLTFIGSILGIITASLTIYSFSSKAQTSSDETSTSTTVYILSSTEESGQTTTQASQEASITSTETSSTSSQETASSSSSQESTTTTEPASETVSGASQTSDWNHLKIGKERMIQILSFIIYSALGNQSSPYILGYNQSYKIFFNSSKSSWLVDQEVASRITVRFSSYFSQKL